MEKQYLKPWEKVQLPLENIQEEKTEIRGEICGEKEGYSP